MTLASNKRPRRYSRLLVTLQSLVAGVLVISCCSGCVAQGKSFSIDSNSRVPFFGLELSPNDRSTSNDIRSISQQKEKGRSWADPFGTRAPRKENLPRIPFPRTDELPEQTADLDASDGTSF